MSLVRLLAQPGMSYNRVTLRRPEALLWRICGQVRRSSCVCPGVPPGQRGDRLPIDSWTHSLPVVGSNSIRPTGYSDCNFLTTRVDSVGVNSLTFSPDGETLGAINADPNKDPASCFLPAPSDFRLP